MEQTADLLNVNEAAARLRVSRAKFYQIIRTGALPLRKLGRKSLVSSSDLDRFIAGLPVANGGAQ